MCTMTMENTAIGHVVHWYRKFTTYETFSIENCDLQLQEHLEKVNNNAN